MVNFHKHGLRVAVFVVVAVPITGCSTAEPFRADNRRWTKPPRLDPTTLLQASEVGRSAVTEVMFVEDNVLLLDNLVSHVLRRNPTIAAMEHTWRATVARYPQAISLDDPLVSYAIAPETFGSSGGPSRRPTQRMGGSSAAQSRSSMQSRSSGVDDGHKIDISQKLPWPGKLKLRGSIVQEEAEAASHDVDTVRQRLTQETTRAFFDYYYAFRAIEINDVNLSLLIEFQKIAETKYAAGTASKQDPLQAEVERYRLEHRAIVLERNRRVTQARINTLLHRSPELGLPPPPNEANPPSPRPNLASLRIRATNERPELQALVRRLKAKQTAQQLAQKEYLPDFTVMSAYNSLWDADEKRWTVGIGLNLPIQLGRRRGAEREALAEANRLVAELVAGVDSVAFQVTEAFENVVESEHIVSLYSTKFMPTAKENLQAAQSSYQAGKNDFLTLLTAEKNLMLVQLAYQQALAEYHQRWADLARAVGGEIMPADVPETRDDGANDDD